MFPFIFAGRYYDPNEALSVEPGTVTKYVDGVNGDDDDYDGSSPIVEGGGVGPYKTIDEALDRYTDRDAGYRVLILAGTYYDTITIPNTWEVDGTFLTDPFVIGPYGDGEVIIDGSLHDDLGSWSAHDANIYK